MQCSSVSHFCSSLALQTRGAGMFEVQLLGYQNPGNRDWQKNCCTGGEVDDNCVSSCSTFFTACLGPLSDNPSPPCSFGQTETPVMDLRSFSDPSKTLLQLPMAFQAWRVSSANLPPTFN